MKANDVVFITQHMGNHRNARSVEIMGVKSYLLAIGYTAARVLFAHHTL